MDETLARGLACGDRDRMGQLLAQLESRLLAAARRVVGPDAAADVVQSAEQALRRLGAEDRTLLTTTALDGRSLAAVGAELGLSLAAVNSRAFRARRRLARNLARA